MVGVVELSGSVIESPQGLHSNAYKSSVKARLMIWKVIGLPQTGQATSLLGVKTSLIGALCTSMTECDIDADQHVGKTPPRALLALTILRPDNRGDLEDVSSSRLCGSGESRQSYDPDQCSFAIRAV
jgi:hypothetical protein